MESAIEETNLSNNFRKLKTTMKILTLHQPGDILKYINNRLLFDDFTEDDMRRIMKQRVDFSKEAVERIKLSKS